MILLLALFFCVEIGVCAPFFVILWQTKELTASAQESENLIDILCQKKRRSDQRRSPFSFIITRNSDRELYFGAVSQHHIIG
jgi:hypothetical protein